MGWPPSQKWLQTTADLKNYSKGSRPGAFLTHCLLWGLLRGVNFLLSAEGFVAKVTELYQLMEQGLGRKCRPRLVTWQVCFFWRRPSWSTVSGTWITFMSNATVGKTYADFGEESYQRYCWLVRAVARPSDQSLNHLIHLLFSKCTDDRECVRHII